MGILDRHNANPKAEMLKGVYHDNLRIAGRQEHNDRLNKRASLHRQLGLTLLIVLAAALYPFSEQDRSSSAKEVFPQMVQAAASANSRAAVQALEQNTTRRPGSIPPDLAAQRAPHPDWDWDLSVPANQNFLNYSILFSRSEPVRLSSLFGLEIKTIVIDPGHGGKDPGAIGAKGTMEKNITLDVAVRLMKKLRTVGNFVVLLTRDSDQTLSLANRVEFARLNKADLFISIHVNSMPNHALNAIETYYFGPPLNAETLQIAEQENKESHYTIGELNAIIQDIGNTVKRQESAMLATAIQKSLLKNVRRHDAQVRDFGIKMAPFVVLSQVEVPSVLVEIACLTKKQEEAKLASAKYREKVAAFMEEGIVAYLDSQQFKLITGGN